MPCGKYRSAKKRAQCRARKGAKRKKRGGKRKR